MWTLVSRVLFYLIIYLALPLPIGSSGFCDQPRRAIVASKLTRRLISLQQTGVTSVRSHLRSLWAFTPLVSPVPDPC